MTAAAFEARHCPTMVNEISETKLYIRASPTAGIKTLLARVPSPVLIVEKHWYHPSLANWLST